MTRLQWLVLAAGAGSTSTEICASRLLAAHARDAVNEQLLPTAP